MTWTAHWIAHPEADWPGTPTPAQVVAGNLQGGLVPAALKGSAPIADVAEQVVSESSLLKSAIPNTTYRFAWAFVDDETGVMSVVSESTVTTSPIGLYYIAVPVGSAAPTPQEIVAGVDYGAVTVLAAGATTYSGPGPQDADEAPVTGADIEQAYDQWWVAFDGQNYGVPTVGTISGLEAIEGSVLAAEDGADAAAISGTIFSGVGGAVAAAEEADDSALVEGSVNITGVAAGQDADDVASIGGSVAVAGSILSTETSGDTAASSGSIAVAGELAGQEADDSASVDASLLVQGLVFGEESLTDTAAINGSSSVSGIVSAADEPDTTAVQGAVVVAGVASAVEPDDDGAALQGSLAVQGELATTDVGDAFSAFGQVRVNGSALAAEAGVDTAELIGGVGRMGNVAAAETGADAASVDGRVLVAGLFGVAETAIDQAALSGDVLIQGSMSAVELPDEAYAFGDVLIQGASSAAEIGEDSATGTGSVVVGGMMTAIEGETDGTNLEGQIYVQGGFAAIEDETDSSAIQGVIVTVVIPTDEPHSFQPIRFMRTIQYSSNDALSVFLGDETGQPVLGATPQIYVSKAGNEFIIASASVTEIGFGWYRLNLTPVDTNTEGELIVVVTAPGVRTVDLMYHVQIPVAEKVWTHSFVGSKLLTVAKFLGLK